MTTDAYRRKRRYALARRFRETLSPDDFTRMDEADDAVFYQRDRFVAHLDARALQTVHDLVGQLLSPRDEQVLDLMASWDSHIPAEQRLQRLVGLGLNATELAGNDRLTERVIHDLNRDPTLPFATESFDAVLNTVSVDYLTQPLQVFNEAARVLRPGGLILVIFSNRMFETKATKLWRQAAEPERVILVEEFIKQTLGFHPLGGHVSCGWPRPPDDKYARALTFSDPVYAVWAEKEGHGEPRRPRTISLLGDAIDRGRSKSVREVAQTLTCRHCGTPLQRIPLEEGGAADWLGSEVYVCLEDSCPYFIAGWSDNYQRGVPGMSFRFMYDPAHRWCGPLPVASADALKNLVERPASSPNH